MHVVDENKIKTLTPERVHILRDKGTESKFSGKFLDGAGRGTYLCRACGLALFRASHQFVSACGWPSFDDELPGTIDRLPDPDGRRTEILCHRCHGHLGHVFMGEQYTERNLRHCVNSLSVEFVASETVNDTEEAILAAGCFWGVEYYLKRLKGVLLTEVGYTGGQVENPTYQAVCTKKTGHFEAIRVVYDRAELSYEALIKYFFEIHDSTQTNGQGPDLGPQYLSAIFYENEMQKKVATQVVEVLKKKGHPVATTLHPATVFWPAENDHQDYYAKEGKGPYCHRYTPLFS